MEQINTTAPAQLDIDWSGEVRYPDVPASGAQSTVPAAPAASAAVQRPAGETQMTTAVPATPVTPVTPALQAVHGSVPYYHLSYDELRGDDFPVVKRDPLDLDNPLTQEEMANPTSNSEVYQASLKSLLARNLGYYVVATFQIGGQGTVSVPGILHTVGNDYIVLYQPESGRYVTGDLYALKFVDFHETQSAPRTSLR